MGLALQDTPCHRPSVARPSQGYTGRPWPCTALESPPGAPRLAIGQVVKRRSARTGELMFQLVQGYKVPDGAAAEAAPRPAAESAEGAEGAHGYSLSSWQRSGHRFSSHLGFGASELCQLLGRLSAFAGAGRFDAANHAAAFGAWEGRYADAPVSPAFACRELTDEAIIGHGMRPLADSLAGWLAGQAGRRAAPPRR